MPRHVLKTAHDYRDPASFRIPWRKRCIVLPEDLVERLFHWHGGQSTNLYALASTGMRHLVSLSMIDNAMSEIESFIGKTKGKDRRSVEDLHADLERVRLYWKEHSAHESKYEYDLADHGLTLKVENEIPTKSH